MNMTAYMALLADKQPWNLIAFMAAPMILAESLVVAEFFLIDCLGDPDRQGRAKRIALFSKITGLILAAYYLALVLAFPFGMLDEIKMQSWIDTTATAAFVLAVVPAFAVAFTGLNVTRKTLTRHVLSLVAYLVLAHVAMIFGMLDPLPGAGHAHHPMHGAFSMEQSPEIALTDNATARAPDADSPCPSAHAMHTAQAEPMTPEPRHGRDCEQDRFDEPPAFAADAPHDSAGQTDRETDTHQRHHHRHHHPHQPQGHDSFVEGSCTGEC